MSSDVSLSQGSTSSSLLSGSIKWTGLASGTDFASVVKGLVDIERRTITRQETWKAQWQAKLTAISTLDTKLNDLKLSGQDYDTRSELLTRSAASSKEGVATVTNVSTAPTGSYTITVGENIVEKVASRSYKKGEDIGGTGPITIQIGSGTALTLTAAANPASPGVGEYNPTGDLEELAGAININAVLQNAQFKAEVIYDKTRTGEEYQRLIITGLDGGNANHITVTDTDSNLKLGRNSIDSVYKTTWDFSTAAPEVTSSSSYTGHVNKTITFMVSNSGVLGADDVTVSWADTENKSGTFTITAADWNADHDKEFDVIQGIKLKFGAGRLAKGESFTVDCQAPVMQKAADSGMAQTDRWVHTGFADLISPVSPDNAGQFIYSYAGKEYTLAVQQNDSLSTLVDKINKDPDNPGVTASVINDGMGTSTSYRMVLTGNKPGAENAIRIIEPSDTTKRLSNFHVGGGFFKHSREASNSMSRVDGFPDDEESWIQRPGVDLGDVIDGVVVTLTGVGETTLTVANDVNGMGNKIVTFVNMVNDVKNYIKEQTKWGKDNKMGITVDEDTGTITRTESAPSGVMIGNYGFQIAQTEIDTAMMSNILPSSIQNMKGDVKAKNDAIAKYVADNNLTFTKDVATKNSDGTVTNVATKCNILTLTDVGITSDPNGAGLYTIDQKVLREALTQNPEAVIGLFTNDGKESIVLRKFEISGTEVLTTRGVADRMSDICELLTSTEDITDRNTGQLIQKSMGITKTLIDNYNNIIKGINEKIAREEYRIGLVKDRLTEKFARLEKALTTLNGQSERLTAAIEKLDKK